MSKKNNILIINQGNTTNYGDIAINKTITTFFEDKGIHVDFFPFWSEEKVFGKKYSKIPKIIMRIIQHLPFILDIFYKRNIKINIKNLNYDGVVIGGGELLCGHRGFNSALYVWTKLLKNKNIPIYLLGVSGDIEMSKVLLIRNRKSLNRCSKIYVRDKYTYKVCKNFYNVKCNYNPDVVFAFNKICKRKNDNKISKKFIMCVPINYNNQVKNNLKIENINQYYKYLVNLIKENNNDNKNVIITSSVLYDNSFSKDFYIYAKNNLNGVEVIFKEYSNLNDYITLLNESQIVISGRMHALILGLIYGCNIVIIPFKKKLKVFQDEYVNIKDIYKVEENALEGLEDLFKVIVKNREKIW